MAAADFHEASRRCVESIDIDEYLTTSHVAWHNAWRVIGWRQVREETRASQRDAIEVSHSQLIAQNSVLVCRTIKQSMPNVAHEGFELWRNLGCRQFSRIIAHVCGQLTPEVELRADHTIASAASFQRPLGSSNER